MPKAKQSPRLRPTTGRPATKRGSGKWPTRCAVAWTPPSTSTSCSALIFLKYISDAFEAQHAQLEAEQAQGADPEDPDEYRALNIFWVLPEARWAHLKAQARQPTIGQIVDDAMVGIERDNASLKGVLPKDYARPALDKERLGQLIDLISNIRIGDEASRAKDVLGRIYEYFLSQFASAEGKKGGEFYTALRGQAPGRDARALPRPGVRPCCGSSGMFVQSVEFIRAHATGNGNGGRARTDISIYGQESNYTTWRLARMNLAIRGIDGQIAHGDTFHNDRIPTCGPTSSSPTRPSTSATGAASCCATTSAGSTACRRRATPTSPGCSTSSTTWRPRAWRLRARQRLDVVEPVRRGRDSQAHGRSRPRGLHGGAAGPALLLDADPGVPVVPGARQAERQVPRPPRPRALH